MTSPSSPSGASDRPVPAEADDHLASLAARARRGNLEAGAAKLAAQGKLFVRDRLALLLDPGSFVEDGAAGQRAGGRPARRRRGHRRRHRRRAARVRHGQRPDREGGVVGRAHGREDRAPDRARAARRAAGVLAGRLGRRPHHRPGRALPGPPGRRADLLQPGAAVGQGAAGVLPVRAVGRGRRLHPLVLRRGVHGRGQRLDVPRLAPHGRDGDRRDRHARRDGRGAHARDRVGLRRQPRHRRRRRHRAGDGLVLVPARSLARRAAGVRGRAAGEAAHPGRRAGRGGAGLRHAQGARRSGRRTRASSS